MEDLSLWTLIFAGGAIGLLGIFLGASERELKKVRREVEGLVAQLEHTPKVVNLNDPVEVQPIDSNGATEAAAKDQELHDRIAYLTSELETSQQAADEFRSERDSLKSEHAALAELRATNQQLKGEISHLRGELQSVESRVSAAQSEGQDAASDGMQLQGEIADLKNQLEAQRGQLSELAMARQRLADYESRETIHTDEQKSAQEQIRALQQELFAAKQIFQELDAAHDRRAELERLYQEAKNEIRGLEEERSRWQERVAGRDDQERRGAMLRQQLDELQSKQAALIERHRQFQNDLTAAVRLMEISPDDHGETSAPRSLPTETEARSLPMAMAHADADTMSNGNGGNYETHAESDSSVISPDISPMIPGIDPSTAMISSRRKRRFGIFPA